MKHSIKKDVKELWIDLLNKSPIDNYKGQYYFINLKRDKKTSKPIYPICYSPAALLLISMKFLNYDYAPFTIAFTGKKDVNEKYVLSKSYNGKHTIGFYDAPQDNIFDLKRAEIGIHCKDITIGSDTPLVNQYHWHYNTTSIIPSQLLHRIYNGESDQVGVLNHFLIVPLEHKSFHGMSYKDISKWINETF